MHRNILSPPTLPDQEANSTANQLWNVVLFMFVMSALYVVVWVAIVPEFTPRIVFALPLFPLFGGLLYLLKRGYVQLAAKILVTGLFATLFFAAAFSGGVLAPGYSGLLITVLAAGIFLSRNAALTVASVSVIGGAFLVYLERIDIMPEASQFTDSTTMWIAQALYFFSAASLLRMSTQRISNALDRAQHELEQRRQTEEQLRKAEEKYRELVERLPAVVYSSEPGAAGTWIYVSPRIEELSGYTAQEWMANPHLWYSRMHPEDRDAFIAGEEAAIASGKSFRIEYRFTRKDGRVIWIQDESMKVASDGGKEKTIVQGFLADVTTRKEAEENLRQSELLLSAIIENIPFDFWVCDKDDRYILQNPISKRLAGDLIGKSVEDLELPQHVRTDFKEIHNELLNGYAIRREYDYQFNNESQHSLFIGAPIIDREYTRGFIGMNIDMTEQKQAQQALEEAELKYRTLVEQSSVAMYRDHAAAGAPSIFITPQIEKMLGYTPGEFCSPPDFWLSLIHPEDYGRVMFSIDDVTKSGRNTSEYRLKAKNGKWVWVRDEASLINDKDGKPLYIQGVYVDITSQKVMEAQRESLIAELEAKNAELERFTYTVSHDLKAPLITMGGFLGFLERDATNGDTHRLREDIQRISEANLKMQRLLNELLELSRIGRKMNPPEKIPFGQIVSEAFTRAESQLNRKKVEVMIMTDLPIVNGDRDRLVEVVQNLLDNAAKFMSDQPNPLIEIGAQTSGEKIVFFVRDNGIGIDPKFHKKIFELFDKLNPKIEGTGIGLALVKRIIEVHGGRVWVESQLGQGATFYFTLPGVK